MFLKYFETVLLSPIFSYDDTELLTLLLLPLKCHGLCGAGCLTQRTLGKHSTNSGTSLGVHSILSAQTHPTGITNVLAKMGKVPASLQERGFWT